MYLNSLTGKRNFKLAIKTSHTQKLLKKPEVLKLVNLKNKF